MANSPMNSDTEPVCNAEANGRNITAQHANIDHAQVDHRKLCNRFSGWTEDEIDNLLSGNIVPDHWWQKPDPNFALLELFRLLICHKSLPYTSTWHNIFLSLKLRHPGHLANFLRKIKTTSWKLSQSNDSLGLLTGVPEFTNPQNAQIGSCCASIGITVAWLGNSEDKLKHIVTNQMCIELNKFREKQKISWQEVANFWPRLFPDSSCKPTRDVARHKFKKLSVTRERLRKTGQMELKQWLAAPFIAEVKTTPPPTANPPETSNSQHATPSIQVPSSPSTTVPPTTQILPPADIANNPINSSPANISEYDQRSTLDKLEAEHTASLEACLKEAQNNMRNISQQLQQAEHLVQRFERQKDNYKQEILELKAEQNNLKKQFNAVAARNEFLNEKLSHLSPRNMKKRIRTRDVTIEKLKSSCEELQLEVSKLSGKNAKLFSEKRKFQEKVRRYEKKLGTIEDESTSDEIKDLRRSVKEKNQTIAELELMTNDILQSEQEFLSTYENGHYTSEIRLTVYELLSMGVGSKNVSKIIRTVLERVAKMKVDRLPKSTIIKYMATEQGMLAKHRAYEAIDTSDDAITLHTDGTSKKSHHFLTYLASTSSGTYALSLDDIASETSDVMIQKAEEALKGITSLIDMDQPGRNEEMEEMLFKIKNTMTDRAAVNKAFVRKFETWRADAIPRVLPIWDSLSSRVRENLIHINDLYCGKHLVLNFQEYAQSALYEWERVECDGKLGREKHILWNRGNESASMLAVRSICNCLGPDADPQAGFSFEFNVHLEDKYSEKSHLQEFRGNRFNIPFENSTAVYHHIPHITSLFYSHYKDSERNRLVKSCLWDLEDEIILAGIRAMAMLERQITSPMMAMLDSPLHVMDTSKFYTLTFEKIKQLMVDPTELLHGQTVLFEEHPPVKDHLWDSIFQPVNRNIEELTQQATIIISHSLCLCLQRQVEDHLPGGKYHNPPQATRDETQTCPTHNLAPEYLFSYLDRKQRPMPNVNTITMEGLIMWSMNDTLNYIDSIGTDKAEQLIQRARECRADALRLYQQKRKTIRLQTAEKLRALERKKKTQETKKMEEITHNTEKATEHLLCKTTNDIESLYQHIERAHPNSSDKELNMKYDKALRAQIRYYKSVNISNKLDFKLFHLSHNKVQLSREELIQNLTTIIQFYEQDQQLMDGPDIPCTDTAAEKAQKIETLKRKYQYKPSGEPPQKMKPFPGDNIIGKRISMKFKTQGKRHHFYKGTVIRKSTPADKEDLLEEEDEHYVGQYSFYTVEFDCTKESADLYCYPLRKEWEDGCLSIV